MRSQQLPFQVILISWTLLFHGCNTLNQTQSLLKYSVLTIAYFPSISLDPEPGHLVAAEVQAILCDSIHH